MVPSFLRFVIGLVPLALAQEQVDFSCNSGKNAAAWTTVKKRYRELFKAGVFEGIPRNTMMDAREATVTELNKVKALEPSSAVDDCGLGRLSLQMLSAYTIDDPMTLAQLHGGLQTLADPVMTVLLDVPWIVLAESGWPVFGLLSQLNNRRLQTKLFNTPEADGLNKDAARAFITELTDALGKGDIKELRTLSAMVLNTELLRENTMGSLTALATQAAVEANPQGRIKLLGLLQNAFRQAFGSAAELDFGLGSRWPLWGLVHVAVDGLAEGLQGTKA